MALWHCLIARALFPSILSAAAGRYPLYRLDTLAPADLLIGATV
jgi:hypothetical protein